MALARVAAQGQPGRAGVTVEVVATASEFVPLSRTISHPGHAYTDCQGSTSYFGQFSNYGNSGSFSGTAETTTQCNTTFSLPTETRLTTYRRVNYTIAKGEQALYLLSCSQTTEGAVERFRDGGLVGALARSKCPAFEIGSKYTLTIRNTSDARLDDASGGKPYKLEYLSSGGIPVTAPQSATASRPRPASIPPVKVHMTSSPSGGEIYIDGKFFGNTPSDITVAAGEHTVKVAVSGREWSRTIEITAGEISVFAEIPEEK
jgi:PEGA domain